VVTKRPDQALQPTPLPVSLLFLMSYRRVMKPALSGVTELELVTRIKLL
jgi:hypothetical protein